MFTLELKYIMHNHYITDSNFDMFTITREFHATLLFMILTSILLLPLNSL